jgi:hypothetical protein
MPAASVRRHPLARRHSHVVTPIVWRRKEKSPALAALLARLSKAQRAS